MAGLSERWRDLREKMIAEPLPEARIAAGWALGMFIGCSVPFGLQLMVSVPLALLFKVSKIGATVGTLITNPVTIFFIYPAQTYAVNRWILGGSLSWERLKGVEWTWEAVSRLGLEAVASFLLGGVLLGCAMAPATYFAVLRIVRAYRRRQKTESV
jgi:uncharacterized protein (DUF2062 family)